VVFWTDHGEQLWQHNYPTHGGSLFDEEVRSTAFFWAKGITPMAWTSPTTHKDIWPTILAALGIEHDMELTGLPLGDRPADEALFALRYRGPFTFHSVVKDRQKLVYLWNGEKGFYRLDTDPTEVSDAYDPEDPDVQALWELLLPEVEAVYAAMDGAEPVDPGL
jgi:arylsulfatase A-like enzyme